MVISNCSNNYGPYQFPEKLIPLTIIKALSADPIPVYGNGENIRDWLFVEDHAKALLSIFDKGEQGRTYLVGGNAEQRNIDLVTSICRLMDNICPNSDMGPYEELITFVTDRPGHDLRYAIDFSATHNEIGWAPTVSLEEGLRRTIEWYLENKPWWQKIRNRKYQGERLGLRV